MCYYDIDSKLNDFIQQCEGHFLGMAEGIGELYLSSLSVGLAGLTPSRGTDHFHACLICLDIYDHQDSTEIPIELRIGEAQQQKYLLRWSDSIDEQMQRTWSDIQEATELGAAAIAFLLILELTEFTIIDRSRKGTGFDYWLGRKEDANKLIFENQARLEVSGIAKAERISDIERRVKEKLEQTHISDETGLPAFIIVVEFSRPIAWMVKK